MNLHQPDFRTGVIAIVAISLTGCATASKDISSTYVSPLQYQSFVCDQLGAEAIRLQGRIAASGGRLDEASSNDKAITTAGAILFWPALFFIGGTKQQEAAFARLKGEYDAIQQTGIQKKCSSIAATEQPKQANGTAVVR